MQPGFRIGAIGELLWDLLPNGPQLGGAPANFAAMSANLVRASGRAPGIAEDKIFLISRVGADLLGERACLQLRSYGMALDPISIDPDHATGSVTVALDATGAASYRIEENAAWDWIPVTLDLLALGRTLDAIYFGTLAQRAPETRATLRSLVEATRADCVRVFDVNLRAPWWTAEALAWGSAHATILKMSHEEVGAVAKALDMPAQEQTPLEVARSLLMRFPIELIAITRGANGSLLVSRQDAHDHPGVAAEVVDSIGAGDAFTAALTYGFLRKSSLAAMAEEANQWGAWVTTQSGGMPCGRALSS